MAKVRFGKKKYPKKTSKGMGKVEKVMHEFKEGSLHMGKSGKMVKKHSQAVAIAMSEARKAGANIPMKREVMKHRAMA